jgi:hypothetical protein
VAVVILLLIGASLLITVLEQLRDRRRLLAILVAFGTRRSTIAQRDPRDDRERCARRSRRARIAT